MIKDIDFFAIREVFNQNGELVYHWDDLYKNGRQEGFYRYLKSTSEQKEQRIGWMDNGQKNGKEMFRRYNPTCTKSNYLNGIYNKGLSSGDRDFSIRN